MHLFRLDQAAPRVKGASDFGLLGEPWGTLWGALGVPLGTLWCLFCLLLGGAGLHRIQASQGADKIEPVVCQMTFKVRQMQTKGTKKPPFGELWLQS